MDKIFDGVAFRAAKKQASEKLKLMRQVIFDHFLEVSMNKKEEQEMIRYKKGCKKGGKKGGRK